MKYIHFVLVCMCVALLCISPAAALKTKAIIHYSEPEVSAGDEFVLEQGYSLKVLDLNSNSGDLWIKLYLDGKEIELDNYFAEEDDPLEYIRTVVENEDEDDEEEIDYFILRITPDGSVKKSNGVPYSTVTIEQYLDPTEDIDDYLLLDKSYSLKTDSELDLPRLYTVEVTDVDDDEVTLELRRDGRLLKEDELEKGDYFYYSVYTDTGPQTIFLANVKAFIETDNGITVFLDELSLRQNAASVTTEVPEDIGIGVVSPTSGGLRAGRIAIIDYSLDDFYSEVRILLDGEVLDSRNDVSSGTYKAVTGELDAGDHKVTLVVIDEHDDTSFYYEDFSVPVAIEDNVSKSIAELAGSAVETLTKDNISVDVSSDPSSPLLPSDISNIFSLFITVGVFVVFMWFFKKFM